MNLIDFVNKVVRISMYQKDLWILDDGTNTYLQFPIKKSNNKNIENLDYDVEKDLAGYYKIKLENFTTKEYLDFERKRNRFYEIKLLNSLKDFYEFNGDALYVVNKIMDESNEFQQKLYKFLSLIILAWANKYEAKDYNEQMESICKTSHEIITKNELWKIIIFWKIREVNPLLFFVQLKIIQQIIIIKILCYRNILEN